MAVALIFLIRVFDGKIFRMWELQENIPIEEVFENLRCTKEGLTSEGAQERLAIFGYNKLEEKKVLIFKLPSFFFLYKFLNLSPF